MIRTPLWLKAWLTPATIVLASIGVNYLFSFLVSQHNLARETEVLTKSPLHIISKVTSTIENKPVFISYGLVRAGCDSLVNGIPVSTNRSAGRGMKSQIMINHEAKLRLGENTLSLECESQPGFTTSTAHQPFVGEPNTGKLVALLRSFGSIFLGIATSLFLFLVTLIYRVFSPPSTRGRNQRYLNFGLAGLLYMLSYGQIFRLWLEGESATQTHILLRAVFSFHAISVFSLFTGSPLRVRYLNLLLSLLTVLLFDFQERGFIVAYKALCTMFAIQTTYQLYQSIRVRSVRHDVKIFTSIIFAWTIAQWLDVYSLFTSLASYNTPIIMALTCIAFVYLIIYERSRLEQMDTAVGRVIQISKTEVSPRRLLSELSETLLEFTKFSRVSCYLDAFILGQAAAPNQKLIRVFERGYQKPTEQDHEIDLTHGRGEVMARALTTHSLQKGKGADGGYFAVLPLGAHIAVNLSDDHPVSDQQYHFSLETLEKLRPGMESVTQKINELSTTDGNLFQRLKSKLGTGQFTTNLTGYMLDIHDYSSLCERYKAGFDDIFGRFVSRIYLPGLARTLAGVAYPEKLEGDLIAFVCFENLFDSTEEYHDHAATVLKSIKTYQEGAGSELCIRNGFEPIRFAVACSEALSSITLDEIQCRTAGEALTVAKRILDACPRDSIAVDFRSIMHFEKRGFFIGDRRSVFVKKDLVEFSLVKVTTPDNRDVA